MEWEKGYIWALGWAFVRANRELACLPPHSPRTLPSVNNASTPYSERARAFTFFAFLNSCLLNQRPSFGRVRPRLCFSPGRRYVYLVAYLLALRCMLGGYHVKSLKSPTAWTFWSHFSEVFFSFLRQNVRRFCSTSGLTSDLTAFSSQCKSAAWIRRRTVSVVIAVEPTCNLRGSRRCTILASTYSFSRSFSTISTMSLSSAAVVLRGAPVRPSPFFSRISFFIRGPNLCQSQGREKESRGKD